MKPSKKNKLGCRSCSRSYVQQLIKKSLLLYSSLKGKIKRENLFVLNQKLVLNWKNVIKKIKNKSFFKLAKIASKIKKHLPRQKSI